MSKYVLTVVLVTQSRLKMHKKLQYKFILIVALTSLFVLLLVCGGLILSVFLTQSSSIRSTLDYINSNDNLNGSKVQYALKQAKMEYPNSDPENDYRIRYFIVEINIEDEVQLIYTNHIAAIDSSAAKEYYYYAQNDSAEYGSNKNYSYGKYTLENSNIRYIFLDCTLQNENIKTITIYSSLVSSITWVLLTFFVAIVSSKAVQPFAEAINNEKRFITDASHELKTPLAIIQANSDVLTIDQPDNEWIDSTKKQTKRLTELVNNLVLLTKLDEGTSQPSIAKFNISEALYEVAVPFKIIAEKKKIDYKIITKDNIMINGDEENFEKTLSILIDNATRYTNDNGEIKISLIENKKQITLTIYNTCKYIDKETISHVFDRFYCAETSRSKEKSGFGIGLSIAKSLVEKQKGTIYAETKDNKSVSFIVKIKKNYN